MAINIQVNGSSWDGTYTVAVISEFVPDLTVENNSLVLSLKKGLYSQQLTQYAFYAYRTTLQYPIQYLTSQFSIFYENVDGEKIDTGKDFYGVGWEEKTYKSFIPSAYSVLKSDSSYFIEDKYAVISRRKIPLSTLFNSNNAESPSVILHYYMDSFYAAGYTDGGNVFCNPHHGDEYDNLITTWVASQEYKLNAPPSCVYTQVSDISEKTEWTQSQSIARVTISDAIAQYGGYISNVKLIVGTSSTSISGNGHIDVPIVNSGIITPQLIVTDSRGQTTTYILNPITVTAYQKPSIESIELERHVPLGEQDETQVYINATIKQTSITGNSMGVPEVLVGGNDISDDIVWYNEPTHETVYTSTTSASKNIYGIVDASEIFATGSTYNFSFTISDAYSTSESKTEILPTIFITMDFQAGGKEIAFGDKADDSLTNHPSGLFACAMDAEFKGNFDIYMDVSLVLSDCTITDSGTALSVTSGASTLDGLLAQAVIDAFDYATAKEILEV